MSPTSSSEWFSCKLLYIPTLSFIRSKKVGGANSVLYISNILLNTKTGAYVHDIFVFMNFSEFLKHSCNLCECLTARYSHEDSTPMGVCISEAR